MESDRVQLVRSVLEAFSRGDEAGMFERSDPAIVVTQLPDQPDAAPHHGHDGARRAISGWVGTWDDYTMEILDMREIGDRVVVSVHQSGRGKSSGIQMDADTYMVFTVPEDKIAGVQMFSSEREALEAAGDA